MRYHVLAVDYDGTLATDSQVPPDVVKALIKVKATGRKLILVTGRQLEELLPIFAEHVLFDHIVAENGAVLYTPASRQLKLLAEKPPEALITCLNNTQVPISVGHVIVATWEPNQEKALDAIRHTGLEHQLIFNKGAVMILPPGVNKAFGLLEALRELDSSAHNTVAVGDAENDHAMLMAAEFSVAVENALPQIKATVDWTTVRPRGEGVAELINELINDDLYALSQHVTRHKLVLGGLKDGTDFNISPYASRILLAGTSSCGKTTMAAALVEKLLQSHYQFCLIDPEGDYRDAEGVVSIGDAKQMPLISEIIQLLRQPAENLSVCLLAVPLADRPKFFNALLAQVVALRLQTGHPHFLILDETHHLLPKEYSGEVCHFFEEINSFLAITTCTDLLHQSFIRHVNTAIMMGESRWEEMRSFAKHKKLEVPDQPDVNFGNVLVWQEDHPALRCVQTAMPGRLLKRHKRKYASGDMGYNSFYFTGPGHRLNLKAQNLLVFMQIAEGVDDDTWLYHLHRGDYSKWFRTSIKNAELASMSEDVEKKEPNAKRSRDGIFSLINKHYTAPG